MPRSSGRSSRPAPSRAAASRPSYSQPSRAPATTHQAAPPAHQQQASGGGGMMGGMMGMIGQGMAFGGGSAVAHRAVDAVMGPRTVSHEAPAAPAMGAVPAPGGPGQPYTTVAGEVCGNQAKAFQDCVMANDNDIGRCQFYLDMLKECKRSSEGVRTL